MNENPRFGRVQTLVFAKRFSPFCFFESHFILRKQKRKNRTIPRLFDIKMRPKLGCLIFEFQISTSIHHFSKTHFMALQVLERHIFLPGR